MRISILILLCAGCGSSFEPEIFASRTDAGSQSEAGGQEAEASPTDEAAVPTCEQLPYVDLDQPCGPGDVPPSACVEVSRNTCYRCKNGGQKSGCAAVVHVGASPSEPTDSWWCC